MSEFVLDEPGGLSARAQRFLAAEAVRVVEDPGPSDAELRERMAELYGTVDEDFLVLLSSVQRRYLGLSYDSGYFDGRVTYSPTFDPEPGDTDLEILYAVSMQANVGASLTDKGQVKVGFDQYGLVEFDSLDDVIESDALFAASRQFPIRETFGRNLAADAVRSSLTADSELGLTEVPEAGGRYSHWFVGDNAALFYDSLWHELKFTDAPFITVWGADASVVARLERLIT
ncbi:hypothetical protein [Micromonospora gifhornensis]|uniref:hypothetical protein n=1 Tax=Micromonospora gifhornensis TaxID=84594 RepID=UPI00364EECC2